MKIRFNYSTVVELNLGTVEPNLYQVQETLRIKLLMRELRKNLVTCSKKVHGREYNSIEQKRFDLGRWYAEGVGKISC